jgi:hypothetical protein
MAVEQIDSLSVVRALVGQQATQFRFCFSAKPSRGALKGLYLGGPLLTSEFASTSPKHYGVASNDVT